MLKTIIAKTNLITQDQWTHHHSGWPWITCEMKKVFHNGMGIDFFTNGIENNILFAEKPHLKEWVAIMHFTGDGFMKNHLQQKKTKESLKSCHGLFVFSNHVKQFLANLNIEATKITFPTQETTNLFSMNEFMNNPKKELIMIGHWLRKMKSLDEIKTNSYHKVLLICQPNTQLPKTAEIRSYVSNTHYDELLQKNLVFLDLINASCNNAIVECIHRNTPILVNEHPAVKEYLGDDYPLFFTNLDEAANKAEDFNLIQQAHNYLMKKDKTPYTIKSYIKSIATSKIYRNL